MRPERPRHSDERARTLRFAARGAARDVDPVPAELRYKSYAEQVNEQAVSTQQVGPREGTVRRARDIAARAVFL